MTAQDNLLEKVERLVELGRDMRSSYSRDVTLGELTHALFELDMAFSALSSEAERVDG